MRGAATIARRLRSPLRTRPAGGGPDDVRRPPPPRARGAERV